jgi:YVTN family beta-propeller protein
VTDHRRPSSDDRGLGVDLFDDPPWRPEIDDEPTSMARVRHLGFVLFLVFLGLLGGGLVIAAISFVSLIVGFPRSLGPFTFNLTPPLPSAYGIDVALSPDGTRAYVTEPSDDRLVVLDTHSGAVLATVTVGETPSGLAVSPNGSQVWVVNTDLPATTIGSPSTSPSPTTSSSNNASQLNAGSVSVVSTATDSVVGTIAVDGPGPIDAAFSPDGHWAYVTNNGVAAGGSVNIIDTSTLAVVGSYAPTTPLPPGSTGWNPTSVAVSGDGRQLWVSAVNDLDEPSGTPDDVSVFDTATHAQLAEIPVGSGPYFMAMSADGHDAYVADKVSCDIRQIDTSTFKVVSTVSWPAKEGCPFGLAVGPDDAVYTVTGEDHTFDEGHAGNAFGSVHFTSPQGTAPLQATTPPTATVLGKVGTDPVTVALSADGTEAYVVDADRPTVDVVDTATGIVTSVFKLPS